jgi:S1-C subfamily serine protease
MKALLSFVLTMLAVDLAFGDGMTTAVINGNSYSNISKVYVGAGGRVIILFPGGGTSASADKVPQDFLTSWNISQEAQAGAKASEAAVAQNNLDRSIQAGIFREVHGVVYNIRKPQSGWVSFSNVKVAQVLDDGAILDTTPDSYDAHVAIFVKNLPPVSDTDFISFNALPNGTYSYINKKDDDRTIRAYDVGRACGRSEIPALVLSGNVAYAALAVSGTSQKDVVATLPDSDNLTASGSGFFVSQDGYLITNDHVVRNAHKVKVKTSDGVFAADVVRVDETDDLALLKVSGQFKPLCISTNEANLGDSVFTIGFPAIDLQGTQPKYTDGKISSLSGMKDDPNEYQISVPLQPGNSGGPLIDSTGNVQGVVVAKLDDFAALRTMGSLPQNVNYAIKGKLLSDFLSKSPEIKLSAGMRPLRPGSSPVPTVQQSVAIVLVY